MAASQLTESEFVELWNTLQSPIKVARAMGTDVTAVYARRRRVEQRLGIRLDASAPNANPHLTTGHTHSKRHDLGILNGQIIVFSDAHFWPGIRTTAHKALLHFIREIAPHAVVNNGDAFDGASISRHPSIGWERKPSVVDELKACEASLGEIEEAATRARHNVKLLWCMGNHDLRYESRLAANAPQYEQVQGFSLRDHFPAWHTCWAVWNNNDTVIKHRYKGGVHATHNNTVNSGVNIVTGHLHSLKVTPYDDYNGTRYGVDTGTLADPLGPQFEAYLEQGPTNWRSGFVVLTFHNGRLLWPEVVKVCGADLVEFRGKVISVAEKQAAPEEAAA